MQGTGHFGHRGQVVERAARHGLGLVVGAVAVALVEHDGTIFGHQHLAAGGGGVGLAFEGDVVNLGQHARVEALAFGGGVAQAVQVESGNAGVHAHGGRHRDGQLAPRRQRPKQHLRHHQLRGVVVLVAADQGAGAFQKLQRVGVAHGHYHRFQLRVGL